MIGLASYRAPEQTPTFTNGPVSSTGRPISPSPSMRTNSHRGSISSTRSRASPPPSSVATTMKRPLSPVPDDVDPKRSKVEKWRFPHERSRHLCPHRLVLHRTNSGPNPRLVHPRTGRQRTPNTRPIHQVRSFPQFSLYPLVPLAQGFPILQTHTLLLQRSLYAHLIMNDNEISGTIVRTSALPEELGRIEYLLQRQDKYIIYCEFIYLRLVIILEYSLVTWHFQICIRTLWK